MSSWESLGSVPPECLVPARLEAHWASRVLASAASSLLPAAADDSHSALEFEGGALWTQTIDGSPSYRFGLQIAETRLVARDVDGEERATLSLAGQTFERALDWVSETAARLSPGSSKVVRRDFPDFPDHPLGEGAAFSSDHSKALAELGRYYHNAASLLGALRRELAGASPLRLWPHHFDLAILAPIDTDDASTATKTIGIGLSPGDESFAEPYWYVSPWPAPDGEKLPEISGPGAWQDEPFFAAIQLASDRVAAGNAQRSSVQLFLSAAIADGRSMLE